MNKEIRVSYADSDFESYGQSRKRGSGPRRRHADPLDDILEGESRRSASGGWDGKAREPSPGISAVLSVLAPGLGQVYCGRLGAGALWFLGTMLSYGAFFVPGFLVHAVCVWSAYSSALHWRRW